MDFPESLDESESNCPTTDRAQPLGTAIRSWLYGLKYVVDYQLLGKSRPLIRGLVLTNRCNLRCRHCRLVSRGPKDLSFAETIAAVDSFYQEGGRCLYLQGGEPCVWHDGPYCLEDVVDYARGLGYLTVVIYTNGTFPLDTSADTVFVSVDGLRKVHDALRGKSFDRVMDNIRASTHPSLYINYTINNCNKDEIRDFCEFVDSVRNIQGVFFYFHTPYYGNDDLYIDPDERRRILLRLLDYRRRYRILNSRAGLESALRNNWKRPLKICSVYEEGAVYECCRYSGDPGLCEDCGYLSYAEIDQTLKMKPSAILNALKYF
jgi:MoaA/NifB/PqqE/SkfB family radical SAM enzyme